MIDDNEEGYDVNTHKKVIVITQQWAAIVVSVLAAGIVGAFAFAWNANAQIEVLKDNVAVVKKLDLDSRLARIESQLEFLIANPRRR